MSIFLSQAHENYILALYLENSDVIFLCVARSSNSSFIVLLYGYRFDVKFENDEKALLIPESKVVFDDFENFTNT